jgi:hypothetical protein
MANKVWFFPGASRGFGRIWAEAALSAATSSPLLPANSPT